MNDSVDDLADDYDRVRQAGKKVISRSWRWLRAETRTWLLESKHYTEGGASKIVEYPDANSDVEELEHLLGLLDLCVNAKLPNRSEKGAPIPNDACSSEVQSAFSSLLHHRFGMDPIFLRRALYALQQYEMARLLTILPPNKPSTLLSGLGTLAFGVFCLALLIATPAILSTAFVSAARRDYGDTTAALYALGFVAWMISILKNMGKEDSGTKEEQEYHAWSRMNSYQSGNWTATGAGALEYFKDMMQRGLHVPAVAFDLCECLKAQTLR